MRKRLDDREINNPEFSSQDFSQNNRKDYLALAGQAFIREYSDAQIEAVNKALEQKAEKHSRRNEQKELA